MRSHDNQRLASGKAKRIAGQTLHRMTTATVQRVWTSLVATHDIVGLDGPEGQGIAIAKPRSGYTPGARVWLGFTNDGKQWYGCHMPMGRHAQVVFLAIGEKVKQ